MLVTRSCGSLDDSGGWPGEAPASHASGMLEVGHNTSETALVIAPDAAKATKPGTTIVVLTHDHRPYILDCLNSIDEQTIPFERIIVVDGASCDGTTEVVSSWAATRRGSAQIFRITNADNRGPAASLRSSLRLIETESSCFIDGDDFLFPNKNAVQSSRLKREEDDIVLVYSESVRVDDEGQLLHDVVVTPGNALNANSALGNYEPRELTRILLESGSQFAFHSATIRTSALRRADPFSLDIFQVDWDLWLRLSQLGRFLFVPGTVSAYRVWGGSATRSAEYYLRLMQSKVQILQSFLTADTPAPWRKAARRRASKLGRSLFVNSDPWSRVPLGNLARASGSREIRTLWLLSRLRWPSAVARRLVQWRRASRTRSAS